MKRTCMLTFSLLASLPLLAQVQRVTLLEPVKCVGTGLDLLDAQVSVTEDGAVEMHFGHANAWPHVWFALQKTYTIEDWSEYQALSLTVSNPLDKPVNMHVRIDDSPEANGSVHCRQGGVELAAGATAEVRFELNRETIEGMRGQVRQPELDGSGILWIRRSWPEIDFSHIIAFQIFMARPTEDCALRLHKVELLKANVDGLGAFVDRYGQFNKEDWPGKVHSDADFASGRTAEEKDLMEHPEPQDRDEFGGWKTGPQLEATGRFRVIKHEGKWWFVDPAGHLFWSAGITCVRPESGGPMLGREKYFEWLPEEDSPLRPFYGTKGKGWLDFGKINLYRKFGENWRETSHELAVRRLLSWGFNTIGNWSDGGAWDLKRVPYTIPVHFSCPRIEVTDTRSFPDVFGDDFENAARKALEKLVERVSDPWLLGVFVDNELPWSGWGDQSQDLLPYSILSSETASASRQAIGDQLRAKYGDIGKLNEVWGTELKDWPRSGEAVTLNKEQRERANEDLLSACTLLAERYFSICEKTMREILPGVLYFGPRLASYNRQTVEVAARHCDVVCFNIYSYLPDDRTADEMAVELDFPIVIGEYHFGALDRGMFHTGLKKAENQEDRAAKFAAYLTTASEASWCVGAHWFQYRDQPLTGRFDGENYNIGFVTITDTPYPEMRAAAREVNTSLYSRRAGK